MRLELRKEKMKAREALTVEERTQLSEKIVDKILSSPEYMYAHTIMIYKGIRGEVRLEALEDVAKDQNKRLVYPLCISDSEMIALLPADTAAWKSGYYGIQEPIRERSLEIPPEDIDLVICPCTVFDEQGGRMGMGAGFYDRYLEKCANAIVAAVAFECQKTEQIPMKPWDKSMDLIFTEETIYRTKE